MSKRNERVKKQLEKEGNEFRAEHLKSQIYSSIRELFGEHNKEQYTATYKKVISDYIIVKASDLGDEEKDEFDRLIEEGLKRHEEEVVIETLDGNKLTKKQLKKLKRDKEKKDAVDSGDSVVKSERGAHLIPKEKIDYPHELLKHPKLGNLLKLHEKGGVEGKKGRIGMRKLGFKLSDQTTWTPFLKEVKKVK